MGEQNAIIAILQKKLKEELAAPFSTIVDTLNFHAAPDAPKLEVPPEMVGRIVGELFGDPPPPVEALHAAKRVFREQATDPTAGALQMIASLLYNATIATALVRHDQRITLRDDAALRKQFVEIAGLPWVSEELSSLLDEAAARLAPAPSRYAAQYTPKPPPADLSTPAGEPLTLSAALAEAIARDKEKSELQNQSRRPSRLAQLPRQTVLVASFIAVAVLSISTYAVWLRGDDEWGNDNKPSFTLSDAQATDAPPSSAAQVSPVSGSILESNFEGFLDVVNANVICGWAWDRTKPNTPINVAIDDGVNPTATVLADHEDAGLAGAKKGDGRHRFFYKTPAILKDGKQHIIRVRIAGTKYALTNSDKGLLAATAGGLPSGLATAPIPKPTDAPAHTPAEARAILWDLFKDAQSEHILTYKCAGDWYFHVNELLAFGTSAQEGEPAGAFPLVSPGKDPLPAIVEFKKELEERGIALIVVPIPGKICFYGDVLDPRLATAGRIDEYYQQFTAAMRKEGVTVVDPYDDFVALRKQGINCFLKQDTHASPAAMRAIAKRVAEIIRAQSWYAAYPKLANVHAEDAARTWAGDLPTYFQENPAPEPERVSMKKVFVGDAVVNSSDPQGPILILGDSTGAVFMSDGDGLGPGLTGELSVRFDVCSVAGQPGDGSRMLLKRRGSNNLVGKKCVVWSFDEMFWYIGETGWKRFRVTDSTAAAPTVSPSITSTTSPPQSSGSGRFFVPTTTDGVTVRGVVKALSAVGEPGKSPYKDHIMTIQLAELTDEKGTPLSSREALVCALSMRDYMVLPAGKFKVGDHVTMTLYPWSTVSEATQRLNRSELNDDALLLEEHVWGDVETP